MAISEKEEELILRYLDKSLSINEQEEFDKLYSQSEPFRQELNSSRDVMASILAHQRVAFKKEVKEVFDQMEKTTTSKGKIRKINSNYYLGAVAAAVILLLVVFIPNWSKLEKVNSEELYAAYYQKLPANNSVRDLVEIPEGIELYELGEYEKAIPLLKGTKLRQTYKIASVYLGVSLIETGQLEEANVVFKQIVIENNDAFNIQHANWYLGLLAIKNNNYELAKVKLQSIISEQGIYEKEAQKLLEELN